ncbi:MAG: NUDIX domain-containing protein [Candidatus Babeliaceae bacterium]|nr:NUDIX domain-containing protein [Candidatus Babeliaceae bacterium]
MNGIIFPNFALLFLINPQQEILLLRRINTPFSNHSYSLPGGEIKLGESATQAAIREAGISLDIHIKPENLHFVHLMSRKCNDPEFFACVFRVDSYDGTLCNNQPARHDDLRWFAFDKLPENIVAAHRQAIEMIEKHISYSEHGWGPK